MRYRMVSPLKHSTSWAYIEHLLSLVPFGLAEWSLVTQLELFLPIYTIYAKAPEARFPMPHSKTLTVIQS